MALPTLADALRHLIGQLRHLQNSADRLTETQPEDQPSPSARQEWDERAAELRSTVRSTLKSARMQQAIVLKHDVDAGLAAELGRLIDALDQAAGEMAIRH